MNTKTHGLSIEIEQSKDIFFISIKAKGTLTHLDYEKINSTIDGALKRVKEPKLKILLDSMELDGWELRAMYDDFKLGLKYKNKFEKVAICGNKKWHELSAKLGNWFLKGEVKYFENLENASKWLHS